jgi:hypothetical protein
LFTLVLESVNRTACLNRCRLTVYCEWCGIMKFLDLRLKITPANKRLLFWGEGDGGEGDCVLRPRPALLIRGIKKWITTISVCNHSGATCDWIISKRKRDPVTGPVGTRGFQEV